MTQSAAITPTDKSADCGLAYQEPRSPISPDSIRLIAQSQGETIQERLAIIAVPASKPPRSRERAAAVEEASKVWGRSVRQIYRWLAAHEANGEGGLARARPSNAGQARIKLTRRFDSAFRAAGYPEDMLEDVAFENNLFLMSCWKGTLQRAGWRVIADLAQQELDKQCRSRGLDIPKDACRLPRRRVERSRPLRVVDIFKNDKSEFYNHAPDVPRTWTHLAPSEWQIFDVKHFDILFEREDGTVCTPKAVAVLDGGTQRVKLFPVLLKAGKGIRQQHTAEALLAVGADPRWGLPKVLYYDRGSEFRIVKKYAVALARLNDLKIPTVVKCVQACPYNAQAKPIEGWFGRFDRRMLTQFDGYIGSDRLKKKTHNRGQAPRSYAGTWEQFVDDLQQAVDAYNTWAVGGQWGGHSPEEWFAAKLERGWTATVVDENVVDLALSEWRTYPVDRGRVRINETRFTHSLLWSSPEAVEIEVALPWRQGALPQFRLSGQPWRHLRIDVGFPADSLAGAEEKGRRMTPYINGVRRLDKVAPDVNGAELLRNLHLSERASAPEPRRLAPSNDYRIAEVGHEPANEFLSPEQMTHARQMEELARWERRHGPSLAD